MPLHTLGRTAGVRSRQTRQPSAPYHATHVMPVQVRIGGFAREGGVFELRRGVRVMVHGQYNPDTEENDVALVLLNRPSTKTPVRLPPRKAPPLLP